MKTVHKACTVLGTISAFAISLHVSASPFEHTVDASGAGPILLNYGDHTINSQLANNLDVNTYRFAGKIGDNIRFNVASFTTGFDPLVQLRGPTNNLLQSVVCNGNGGPCSIGFDQPLTANGIYTISVSDFSGDEAGSYVAHLDARAHYAGVGYGPTWKITEQLGHNNDVDFYAFNGNANTLANISVRSLDQGVDPHLEVWNPQGVSILDTVCNGNGGPCTTPDPGTFLTLALTGTYIFGISDFASDETGKYEFQVSCLTGSCPGTIPLPKYPEPSTYALMLGGLGLVGFLVRKRNGSQSA